MDPAFFVGWDPAVMAYLVCVRSTRERRDVAGSARYIYVSSIWEGFVTRDRYSAMSLIWIGFAERARFSLVSSTCGGSFVVA